jgi:single-strand DNA-binding protein
MPYSTETQITLNGWIATAPRLSVCANGSARAAFRLAVPERRFDRAAAAWATAATSYYTVVCWRRLAEHAAAALGRGDPVIVVGRQRVVEWVKEGRQGTAVEVEAVSVGHDLRFGVSDFRSVPREQREAPVLGGEPVATDSVAADGGGAEPGSADSGGAESEGAGAGDADSGGAESGGAESKGAGAGAVGFRDTSFRGAGFRGAGSRAVGSRGAGSVRDGVAVPPAEPGGRPAESGISWLAIDSDPTLSTAIGPDAAPRTAIGSDRAPAVLIDSELTPRAVTSPDATRTAAVTAALIATTMATAHALPASAAPSASSASPLSGGSDTNAKGAGETRRGGARARSRPLDHRRVQDHDVPSGGSRPGPDRVLAPSKL